MYSCYVCTIARVLYHPFKDKTPASSNAAHQFAKIRSCFLLALATEKLSENHETIVQTVIPILLFFQKRRLPTPRISSGSGS